MPNAGPTTGIIIVDHGSRREESNDMLLVAVQAFRANSDYAVVEAAHMELAQPDIATAYRRCVEQGATRIVVFPYFLSPGRHWSQDIPKLTESAAATHPQTTWMVTAPFGLHPDMSRIIGDRIEHCLQTAASGSGECDVCSDGESCHLSHGGQRRES